MSKKPAAAPGAELSIIHFFFFVYSGSILPLGSSCKPLVVFCCVNEAIDVLNNASVVGECGNIQCPALLFSSNGEDQEKDWVENQQKFAEIMGARLISYDCGHYIHHFHSDEMCKEITEFAKSLEC